jgi:hypothetical protein
MPKKTLYLLLDEELAKKFKMACVEKSTPMSQVITEFMVKFLETKDENGCKRKK